MSNTKILQLLNAMYRSAYNGAYSIIGRQVCHGIDSELIASEVQADYLPLLQQELESTIGKKVRNPRSWAYVKGRSKAIDAFRKEVVARSHWPALARSIEQCATDTIQTNIGDVDVKLIQSTMFNQTFEKAFVQFCCDCMELSLSDTTDFWAECTGQRVSRRTISHRLRQARDRLRNAIRRSSLSAQRLK